MKAVRWRTSGGRKEAGDRQENVSDNEIVKFRREWRWVVVVMILEYLRRREANRVNEMQRE